MSIRQKKFGAAVHRAMQAVLQRNENLFQSLVRDGGICFREIRMSPDNTKAFILWDTYKKDTDYASSLLRQHTGTLKHLVGKALATKKAPYFEFVAHFDDNLVRRRHEYDKLQETLDAIRQEDASQSCDSCVNSNVDA